MTFGGRQRSSNHAKPENKPSCNAQAQREYHTLCDGIHFLLLRLAPFLYLPPKFLSKFSDMTFFCFDFGRRVTEITAERRVHTFCFDNLYSDLITCAENGFLPKYMLILVYFQSTNV
jgi:hypothetical protein